MNFEQAIARGYEKYADFSGRAGRSEFYWFALYLVLVVAACDRISDQLTELFLIGHLLPALAAATRRVRAVLARRREEFAR
jgi:uncharacterized membrane protein YhaH (DUF805 family)